MRTADNGAPPDCGIGADIGTGGICLGNGAGIGFDDMFGNDTSIGAPDLCGPKSLLTSTVFSSLSIGTYCLNGKCLSGH